MASICGRLRWLAFALAILASGCDDGPASPSDALGDVWRLVSIQESRDPAPVTVGNPGRYRVRFESNGHVAVTSDCNSCGGSYTLTGSTLVIPALACTKAACGAASFDPRYPTLLGQAQTLTLQDDDDMTISGPAGTLTFRK